MSNDMTTAQQKVYDALVELDKSVIVKVLGVAKCQ